MSRYTVSGRYQARDGYQSFTKTIDAPNDSVARDRAYATLGSEHGLKRAQIELDEVEA